MTSGAAPKTGALPLALAGLTPGYFRTDETMRAQAFHLSENIPAGGARRRREIPPKAGREGQQA
jgi:hypothetical protein